MNTTSSKSDDKDLVLSFLAVRQFLGMLGIALPVGLYLFARVLGYGMQPSISDFYHTEAGDLLVGSLWAIGIFLLAYKGRTSRPERWWVGDREASIVAGLAAIGVATFPVSRSADVAKCFNGKIAGICEAIRGVPEDVCIGNACTIEAADPVTGFFGHPDIMHYGSAFVFFGCLAYFCLVLFRMGGKRTPAGKAANSAEHTVYLACGYAILISIAALVFYFFAESLRSDLRSVNYIFWWESVAVIAFSISWLTKGRILRQPFGFQLGKMGEKSES
ncbi:MAG: hypothetical protein ACU0DI_09775 [Paracoccaceae bacterium]